MFCPLQKYQIQIDSYQNYYVTYSEKLEILIQISLGQITIVVIYYTNFIFETILQIW